MFKCLRIEQRDRDVPTYIIALWKINELLILAFSKLQIMYHIVLGFVFIQALGHFLVGAFKSMHACQVLYFHYIIFDYPSYCLRSSPFPRDRMSRPADSMAANESLWDVPCFI